MKNDKVSNAEATRHLHNHDQVSRNQHLPKQNIFCIYCGLRQNVDKENMQMQDFQIVLHGIETDVIISKSYGLNNAISFTSKRLVKNRFNKLK